MNVLDAAQIADGYSVERVEDFVLVWRDNVQMALLADGPDIQQRVQQVIARRQRLLRSDTVQHSA